METIRTNDPQLSSTKALEDIKKTHVSIGLVSIYVYDVYFGV